MEGFTSSSAIFQRILCWTQQDDQRLLQHVAESGTKEWEHALEPLKSAAELLVIRWCALVSSSVKRPCWSQAELALLIKAYQQARPLREDGKLGAQAFYNAVSQFLPGRSASAVRQAVNVKLKEMGVHDRRDGPETFTNEAWQEVLSPWLTAAEAQMAESRAKQLAGVLLQGLSTPLCPGEEPADSAAAAGGVPATTQRQPSAGHGSAAPGTTAAADSSAAAAAGSSGGGVPPDASGSRPCSPGPAPAGIDALLQGAASAPACSNVACRPLLDPVLSSRSVPLASTISMQQQPTQLGLPAVQAAAPHKASTAGCSTAINRKRKLASSDPTNFAALTAPSAAPGEAARFAGASAPAGGAPAAQMHAADIHPAALGCMSAMAVADACGEFAAGVARDQDVQAWGSAAQDDMQQCAHGPAQEASAAGSLAAVWARIQNSGRSSNQPAQQTAAHMHVHESQSAPLGTTLGSKAGALPLLSPEHLITVESLGALQLEPISPNESPAGQLPQGSGQSAQGTAGPPAASVAQLAADVLMARQAQRTAALAASAAPGAAHGGSATAVHAGMQVAALEQASAMAAGSRGAVDTARTPDQHMHKSSSCPGLNHAQSIDKIERTLHQLEQLQDSGDLEVQRAKVQALDDAVSLGQLLFSTDSIDGPETLSRVLACLPSVTSAALGSTPQQEASASAGAVPGVADTTAPAAHAVAAAAAPTGAAGAATFTNSMPNNSMAGDRGSATVLPGRVSAQTGSTSFDGIQDVAATLQSLQQQLAELEPQVVAYRQQQQTQRQSEQMGMQGQLPEQQMHEAAGQDLAGIAWLQQQQAGLLASAAPRRHASAHNLGAHGSWAGAPVATGAAADFAPGAGMSAQPDARMVAMQLEQQQHMGLMSPGTVSAAAFNAASYAGAAGMGAISNNAGLPDMQANLAGPSASPLERVAGYEAALAGMQNMIRGIFDMSRAISGSQSAAARRWIATQVNLLEDQQRWLLQRIQEEGALLWAGPTPQLQQPLQPGSFQMPPGMLAGGSMATYGSVGTALQGELGLVMGGQVDMQAQHLLTTPSAVPWSFAGHTPMH